MLFFLKIGVSGIRKATVRSFRVVYALMVVFFVIAWPLSKVLDCLLGKEEYKYLRSVNPEHKFTTQPQDIAVHSHQVLHLFFRCSKFDRICLQEGGVESTGWHARSVSTGLWR